MVGKEKQLWLKEDTRALLVRIGDAMHFRGIKKAGLARVLGVTESAVSQWFTAERLPEAETLLAVMRLLGGDGNWWLGMEGQAPPRDRLPVPPRETVTQVKRVAESVKAARKGTQPKRAGRKGE